MKYGVWNVGEGAQSAVNALAEGGYAPLAAMVLAARGIQTPAQAEAVLGFDTPLPDPFSLTDMAAAAGRVGLAMTRGEKIAIFGDYDVDGITATCLLTHFLRRHGADCVPYIPGRLEEGYGLNETALRQLACEGVKLVVTVDCGITAVEETALAKQLGMDVVITDHHECKENLPGAVAVVDPHRPDGGYQGGSLSGVGVAFKLVCALSGDPAEMLQEYADMVCLGTVADVIPLVGENRIYVKKGLEALNSHPRPGLAALMAQCGCESGSVTASTIGYMLAPRINAAGRMGKIDAAVELFLTQDPVRGEAAARELCELNRERQAVESEIYRQAVEHLRGSAAPDAIVLADERWHQGVVGIVASRIAEEYACPAFLICLDGEHGKASSRSHGGFNLFASLRALSGLLESYGGHELAAGFTISRENIPEFRRQISELARTYFQDDVPRQALDIDCTVTPEVLTVYNIDSLGILEPCGCGCPKPILMLKDAVIDRITMVGNGRHMRLRLRCGHYGLNAIYFSMTPETASIAPGDRVDVAFVPQVNEYRGERTPQLNVVDIRPSCTAPCGTETAAYRMLREDRITPRDAEALLPSRQTLAIVWRYLSSRGTGQESPICLCRKIVRWSEQPMNLGQLMTCLDIFQDVGLLQFHRTRNCITIQLTPGPGKADLSESQTMQRLLRAKES
ncbi:MAG: single-stranded-DNA-specific exonuclease RecJ [Butyricicoccaceae bacterium]